MAFGKRLTDHPAGDDAEVRPPARTGLADILGARVFEDCTIARTKIRGKMRMLTRDEQIDVTLSARKAATDLGLSMADIGPLGVAYEDWNAELAVRTLAVAVRDPGDADFQLDDLDAWREKLDDGQIGGLFLQYKDMVKRLDPLADDVVITLDELTTIEAAVKKKDVDLLRSFGSSKLARYVITLADQLATSPTPR